MKEKSILIVDDDASVRDSLNIIFKDDYNLILVNSAEIAMQELENNPTIKLVTLDIRMKGIDGLTALKIIKNDFPDILVVIVTAGGIDDLQKMAELFGADDYISKPFDVDNILDRIKNLLGD